jgi:hypothetical protein
MRAIFGAILVSIMLTIGGVAQAEQVSANSLNCRSSPDAASPAIAKLVRGQHVEVREAGGGWSHVVSPNCWVVARYLVADRTYSEPIRPTRYTSSPRQSYGSPNYLSTPKAYSAKRKSYGAVRTKRSSSRRRSRSSGSYGGSCPCSGSNICIGPRGGRYCITSGGNKRYGV